MTKLRLTATIALLTVPLMLGGCASNGDVIAALEAPAGPKDETPAGVNLPLLKQVDATTVRFLVEDDGCAVLVGNSSNKIVTVSGTDERPAALVPDNADTVRLEAEGLTRIHQNVYVGERQKSPTD